MWRVICKMLCFSFRIVSLCNKCRKSDLKVINAGPLRINAAEQRSFWLPACGRFNGLLMQCICYRCACSAARPMAGS